MKSTLKYVGLDVSKEKISVAIADEGREKPRHWGYIPHTPEAIRKLVKKLGDPQYLRFCYEAGPTGYPLYRQFLAMDIHCEVIAPSLIPQQPGKKIKTDKRDAIRLAQLYRAGELVSVYVPTPEDEALRDLVRAREDAKEDELRVKNRLTKFLLRHNIYPPKDVGKNWSKKYRAWLDTLTLKYKPAQLTFQEYYHQLHELEQRIERYEKEIKTQASEGVHASTIQALQSLRGIALLTAVSLAAEIGSFSRFPKPGQLMGYIGLVPSESSSGSVRYQGEMTKTGNRHVRRLLIEAAWSYRYKPAVKGDLKKRLDGLPPEFHAISWKAQNRLHTKYYRLISRGKEKGKAVAAIARELAGFIWAVMQEDLPQAK